MEDMTLVKNIDIDSKIQSIINNTNYTIEEAKKLLPQYNYNEILIIKNYLGIMPANDTSHNPVKSVNQEIYRQLRNYLKIEKNNIQQS